MNSDEVSCLFHMIEMSCLLVVDSGDDKRANLQLKASVPAGSMQPDPPAACSLLDHFP